MHPNKLLIFLKILIINSAAFVESYKYLFIFPTTAKSHFIVGSALMEALAKKGHEIYVISAFPQENPMKNYYDISFKPKRMKDDDDVEVTSSWIKKYLYYPHEADVSETVLQHPKIQKLIASNHTFDAVICDLYMSEALFGFSEHFKAPLILLVTTGATAWTTDMIGSPAPSPHMAYAMASYSGHMTFKERVESLFYVTAVKLDMHFDHLPKQAALYKKYFPHAKRDLYAVRKHIAAVLLNTHAHWGYPRPQPRTNHIQVGGMHINHQRQPLPEDLEEFIEEAEHGVVYFSLDSSLESSYLSYETYMELLTTFENLKQKVLWKFNDYNLEGIHDTVYISDWFPQEAILAHENVKLFVTHGGWLNIMESIYYAKPIIGIPTSGDQFLNVALVENQHVGISLEAETLNAEDLVEAVEHVINDESYAEHVKVMSARYRDQPMSPLDLAVYWAEHVARHKDGNYMCCADLELSFIAYDNMDAMFVLYGAILIVALTIFYILNKILKAVWRKIVPRRIRRKLKLSYLWQVSYEAMANKMTPEPEPEALPEPPPRRPPKENRANKTKNKGHKNK